MEQLNRNEPITKVKHSKIFFKLLIGIWFVIPIILLKPFKKIYFASLTTGRIGHIFMDTEILLARIYTDQSKSIKKISVIWIPEAFISNSYVYSIWKQKINVVPYNLVTSAILFSAIFVEKLIKVRITYRFIGWDGYLKYIHLLENTPTVFSMPEADEEECIKTLITNGIDTSKQWVCILARDSGYLNQTFPNLNWDFNTYRNSSIETYEAAAEYLAGKNIITFRMGNNVDRRFPAGNTKLVIDYANSTWQTEKMDIFLAMRCFFFISSGSGLDAVQIATRRPLLGVNIAQPLHIIRSKPNYLFILKYFFHETDNIFLSPHNYYNIGSKLGFTVDNPLHLRSQDIVRLGIKVIDNTSREIKDATVEMYDMLTNKDTNKSELSERQMKFWEKFPKLPEIDNSGPPLSKIGEKFLQQNPWLIE